jgi:hypothetical protein
LLFPGSSEARRLLLSSVFGATVLLSSFGGLTPIQPRDSVLESVAGAGAAAVQSRDGRSEATDSAARQAIVESGRTAVPYMTQFDGTPWEGSNCGIASIAMVLGAFDVTLPTVQVRKSIIAMTGDRSYDAGVAWEPLMRMAWRHNFPVNGPYNDNDRSHGYRRWFLEELDAESRLGRPSILLVHYRSLPGHESATWWGDHYVVFLGLTADGNVIYHDPAFRGSQGAYRVTDRATFERAWTNTASRQVRAAIVVGW